MPGKIARTRGLRRVASRLHRCIPDDDAIVPPLNDSTVADARGEGRKVVGSLTLEVYTRRILIISLGAPLIFHQDTFCLLTFLDMTRHCPLSPLPPLSLFLNARTDLTRRGEIDRVELDR